MVKKIKEQPTSTKKDQIISFLGILPVLRIRHKIGIVEVKGKRVLRLTKMYWLFGFIPLFMTEREWDE